ncbi:lactosylceramide 4-alpha-galactosyltransferase [Lepeophtheirus salmonis]|nr:alpha-1,4-N-acetylglucosaminyltransferase-like [Lepeophtheirus salmonis]
MYSLLSYNMRFQGFFIIFTLSSSVLSTEDCPNEKIKNDIIPLVDIATEDNWENVPKLFFVESSGRDHLLHRQACSVESAIRTNQFPVLVLMLSTHLNPAVNNATRQLTTVYEGRVHFRQVNLKTLLVNTPFDGHWNMIEKGLRGSKNKYAHLSDVIRLAVIYRLGGTYSDIDVIFMRTIQNYENFFSSDQTPYFDDNGVARFGSVANGLFNIATSKSRFIHDAMNLFLDHFDGANWSSGGAKPISVAMKQLCQNKRSFSIQEFTLEKCNGLVQFLDPNLFYPFKWEESAFLHDFYTQQKWEDIFRKTVSVDFFQSSSESTSKILKRKYYGASFPAIVYLGPLFCPVAYDSQKLY